MKIKVTAATDGSAIRNPNGPGGWAWFVDEQNWACGSFPKASNQFAELFAILSVVRAVPSEHHLHIITDSKFSINVLTKWIKSWERAGWKKSDGKPPENLALIKELHKATANRHITYEWVPGHNGMRLNEIADKLCTRASKARDENKTIPSGPGWSGELKNPQKAVTKRQSTSPFNKTSPTTSKQSTASQKTFPKATKPASKPKTTRKTAAPTRTRRKTNNDGVFSWDSWDDETKKIVDKSSPKETIFCGSCNGPINPLTSECRCSFTGGR